MYRFPQIDLEKAMAAHDVLMHIVERRGHGSAAEIRIYPLNPAAELGYRDFREQQGLTIQEYLIQPRLIAAFREVWAPVLEAGAARTSYSMTLPFTKDEPRDFNSTVYLVEWSTEHAVALLIAQDVTEQKQAEAALLQQSAYVQLLQAVASAANEAATITAAVQPTLERICLYTGWVIGRAYLPQPWLADMLARSPEWATLDPDRWAPVAANGVGEPIQRGVGLAGLVWESGEAAWSTAAPSDPNLALAPELAALGIQATFAFPIMVEQTVWGVLEFLSDEWRTPDHQLLELMRHIGVQLGRVVERQQAEEERLRLQAQIIDMQATTLEMLATPLIPITDHILVMPLIGSLGPRRAEHIISKLAQAVVRSRTEHVVIDIKDVPLIDRQLAVALTNILRALRLLGAHAILTGFRPDTNQRLKALGLDLNGVDTYSTLQQGTTKALGRLANEPRRDAPTPWFFGRAIAKM